MNFIALSIHFFILPSLFCKRNIKWKYVPNCFIDNWRRLVIFSWVYWESNAKVTWLVKPSFPPKKKIRAPITTDELFEADSDIFEAFKNIINYQMHWMEMKCSQNGSNGVLGCTVCIVFHQTNINLTFNTSRHKALEHWKNRFDHILKDNQISTWIFVILCF